MGAELWIGGIVLIFVIAVVELLQRLGLTEDD